MKNKIIIFLLLLVSLSSIAQTVVQNPNPPITEAQTSNWVDHVAMAITAISISALIFYLIYLFTGRKKNKS